MVTPTAPRFGIHMYALHYGRSDRAAMHSSDRPAFIVHETRQGTKLNSQACDDDEKEDLRCDIRSPEKWGLQSHDMMVQESATVLHWNTYSVTERVTAQFPHTWKNMRFGRTITKNGGGSSENLPRGTPYYFL